MVAPDGTNDRVLGEQCPAGSAAAAANAALLRELKEKVTGLEEDRDRLVFALSDAVGIDPADRFNLFKKFKGLLKLLLTIETAHTVAGDKRWQITVVLIGVIATAVASYFVGRGAHG